MPTTITDWTIATEIETFTIWLQHYLDVQHLTVFPGLLCQDTNRSSWDIQGRQHMVPWFEEDYQETFCWQVLTCMFCIVPGTAKIQRILKLMLTWCNHFMNAHEPLLFTTTTTVYWNFLMCGNSVQNFTMMTKNKITGKFWPAYKYWWSSVVS